MGAFEPHAGDRPESFGSTARHSFSPGPERGPALRRAGGVKLAHALPIWRLPSGAALQTLPALMRAGLVPEVEPNQPLSIASHLTDPMVPQEWWISRSASIAPSRPAPASR